MLYIFNFNIYFLDARYLRDPQLVNDWEGGKSLAIEPGMVQLIYIYIYIFFLSYKQLMLDT